MKKFAPYRVSDLEKFYHNIFHVVKTFSYFLNFFQHIHESDIVHRDLKVSRKMVYKYISIQFYS